MMSAGTYCGLAVALASVTLSAAQDCPGDVGFGCATVDLANAGRVVGNAWQHGEEFLTIPYATANRFSPPTQRQSLPSNPFDATNILGFGQAACLQVRTIPSLSALLSSSVAPIVTALSNTCVHHRVRMFKGRNRTGPKTASS